MSKLLKRGTPQISPKTLHEFLWQEATKQCTEEQERLRAKVSQEQKEYNQRRMMLSETAKFFRKLEKIASENRRQQNTSKEWVDYVSCQKSPNPNSAAELRQALFRWIYQQKEARSKTLVGWTLPTDERSPTPQGTHSRRCHKRNVNEIYRNIGKIYIQPVREALDVLKSIENDCREKQQDEVLLVRDEIRKFISDSVDQMTICVGSCVARNMTSIDPLMSEFSFHETDVLSLYLWSFRQVPLPSDYNILMKAINMEPLNLVIHRPLLLDLKDSLIRGLWLRFDHFSNQDPTRAIPPLAPIPDLLLNQEMEWNERQEIRGNRLSALRKWREDYKIQERDKQVELQLLSSKDSKKAGEKANTSKSKMKSKEKKPKTKLAAEITPDPLLFIDEIEVDIDAEYECAETDRFWATLSCVAPGTLPLKKGYVNLREYCIVGGIYIIDRFEHAPQPVDLRPDFMYGDVPAGLKLSEKHFYAVDDEGLVKIELRLPVQCCWWEPPTVCCWEQWEESEQFTQLDPKTQQFQLQHAAILDHKASLLFAAKNDTCQLNLPATITDFDLTDIPVEIRLHYLIHEHILPRLPEGYRFRAEIKRLYTVLEKRTVHRLAREQEQKVRDDVMLKYRIILETCLQNGGVSEMRHPLDSDICVEEKKSGDGLEPDVDHDETFIEPQEKDEQLQYFSLIRPDLCYYLYPPNPIHRPLSFITKSDPSDKRFLELGMQMEELVLKLESRDALLDDVADERLCKLFSTFLWLLEYLRKKETPKFPALPSSSPTANRSMASARIVVKQTKRRYIDIRTTKKYPLGLGSRTRSLSQLSESSVPSEQKRKRKRRSSTVREKHLSQSQHVELAPGTSESPPEVLSLIEHAPGRWSTKPIRRQTYDRSKHVLTFWTDRLGVFGLAARRYIHMPFHNWEMRRHEKVASLTTIITLSAPHMDIHFHITLEGFRVHVHNRNGQVNEKKQRDVQSSGTRIAPKIGWFSLEELEKYLLKINVHVFPEVDTCFYTTARTPKHEAMELHGLRCLGAFCLTHNFRCCSWNKFANRRTALVLGRQLIEGRLQADFDTIMITPLKSQLVEVEELCSNSLEEVVLAFHPRPKEQNYNADCYGLLKETLEEPSRKVLAKTPPLLQLNVSQLLQKLRLLSYS